MTALLAAAAPGCSTAAAAASDASAGGVDAAGGRADAAAGGADASALGADASPGGSDAAAKPYRHTIVVDGVNSFSSAETFATTSAGFTAYVTWDDTNLYLGYQGSDVAANDSGKWLFAYIDTDPGGAAGTSTGERYNTEAPGFPAGFAADYYYRWQSSGGIEDLKSWDGDAWQVTGTTVTAAVMGQQLEVAVPRAALGDPATLGVTLFWLNETDQHEAAYGGLYPDSFADGYYATVPVGRYLAVDFASSADPNAAGNRRP